MKTVFTARELMEVAIMCLQQIPDTEPESTLYCRTEGRIVDADYAAAWCYPGGHLIDQSTDGEAA